MRKVLLVEDNAMNSRLAQFVLERGGFEVLQAATAEAGIQIANEREPDIILLDLHLPGMDGLSAARLLKQSPKTSHIPIVALTAHAMQGDEERVVEAGCAGYITKPIDTRQLADTVAGYLKD